MSDAAPIADANADQYAAWNGDQGAYWIEHAERFEQGVAGYHGRFLDAAAIGPGERVLDIGCGIGRTTRDAARRAGSALGLDLSAPMLDRARQLAEQERIANVTFEQGDAQVHPFPGAHFDVAISRNGVMFFGDPPAAFRNIARALRPGGRLVMLTWQAYADNEWLRVLRGILAAGREVPMARPGSPNPWSLSEPGHVRELLTAAGFTGVRLSGLTEPMLLGHDVEDAYQYVMGLFGTMLDDLDEATRATATGALRTDLAAHLTDRGVRYGSAAWLVEAGRP